MCSWPVLNPQGSKEAEPEAVQQADALALRASESHALGVARKVQAVRKQNLTVLPPSSSFLGVLLAGSH